MNTVDFVWGSWVVFHRADGKAIDEATRTTYTPLLLRGFSGSAPIFGPERPEATRRASFIIAKMRRHDQPQNSYKIKTINPPTALRHGRAELLYQQANDQFV